MTIYKVDYCDFIVWTPDLYNEQRLKRDGRSCDQMFATAREFFLREILPEFSSKLFNVRKGIAGSRRLLLLSRTRDREDHCVQQPVMHIQMVSLLMCGNHTSAKGKVALSTMQAR